MFEQNEDERRKSETRVETNCKQRWPDSGGGGGEATPMDLLRLVAIMTHEHGRTMWQPEW